MSALSAPRRSSTGAFRLRPEAEAHRRPRSRWLALALGALLCGHAIRAAAAEKPDAIDAAVADYFRPFLNELAALSPDGEQVAMTELTRDGLASIVIVRVADRTSQRYFVGRAEHAVEQMLWVSPQRLAFTTRSRSVGALELGHGEIEALLLSRDLDGYRPEPTLGPRKTQRIITPDMPADPSNSGFAGMELRRELSLTEARREANVSGDLFGSESKRDQGSALRPFLLGLKPSTPNAVFVELRNDADLYAYARSEHERLIVPGNIYLTERTSPPPDSRDEGTALPGEYAAYDVDYPPAPLVLLELDTVKGRAREIAIEQNLRRVWLDHQGRLRLALEQQGRRFRYLYRGTDAKRWVPLATAVPGAAALGFTATAENLLAPRSVPLGFNAEGNILLFASNVGRDTYGLRALDVAKGLLDEFSLQHERYDLIEPTALTAGDVLQFDPKSHVLMGANFAAARRSSRWFGPQMAALQATLDKQFAPQHCTIRGWNNERSRFLVEVCSPNDAGVYIVVDTATGKMLRCGERAPWLTEARRNPTHEFDFLTDDGRRIAGFLTVPRTPRVKPAPVLVYFHDGPWFSDPPLFNRGAQALAALGFAVLQLNYHGSSGLGRAHLTTATGALDRAVLEDVRAMLSRLNAAKLPINTGMVATLGNGFGGYLAVRMTQLAPDDFRCAVAINAPGDLAAWCSHPSVSPTLLADQRRTFFGTDAQLRSQSAVTAGKTRTPVLVVHASANAYVPASLGRELYRAVKNDAEGTAFLELEGEGHGGWSENTTAHLFAELGRFFNSTIYNYRVDVQKPTTVP